MGVGPLRSLTQSGHARLPATPAMILSILQCYALAFDRCRPVFTYYQAQSPRL